jgi:hypothetical protein
MVLVLKNLLVTLVVPGTVAVYVPVLITQNRALASGLLFALALALLTLGTVNALGPLSKEGVRIERAAQ